MTAPRPEAVELARAIVRAVTFDEYDEDVWNATDLIDAALTAAREEQREKDATIVDQWESAQDAIVTDLNRKLQCTSPHDYTAQCLNGCARAIREGR